MPVSPARAAAFDILLQVEQEDAYASELLNASRYATLSSADHGLTTELVMGVLRWRSLLDEQIARCSSQHLEKLDDEVLTALRLGAYQLGFLERVPPRAALHESVELVKRARKRSAAPFVNAVLRKLAADTSQAKARSQSQAPDAALTPCSAQGRVARISRATNLAELSAIAAHPSWLVERWVRQFGYSAAQNVCGYDQAVPETALRLFEPAAEIELKHDGIELAPGKLLTSAWRVQSGNITQTRAFREGRVAIQDEASQLIALLVGKGSKILDCCAAPGGKTRVIADRNPDASIVAAELHPHRARLLRKLVPAKNVQVIAADVRELPVGTLFDRVLADVPCSGTGTLARNPEIKWRLKPEDFADLQARQLAILQSAMKGVASGGRLVYSTCSLEREENEGVVEKALAADSTFRTIDCRAELERLRVEGELVREDLDSLTDGPYLRTISGVHPCDGFFAAILEKNFS
jgi:16S rRNA (cytosine967-C5)-methyltransferase